MKKLLPVLLFLLLQSVHGFAQGKDSTAVQNPPPPPPPGSDNSTSGNEPFTWVDEMPKFPGGDRALLSYISHNITYPKVAREDSIVGRVVVRFVVEPDGSVSNVSVPKGMGIGGGCDEEAVRVVASLPKWKPGIMKDKPVPVWYTIPIVFKLQ